MLRSLVCLMTGMAFAGALTAQDTIPPQLRQSRDLVAQGKVEDGIAVAERYTREHPREERGFLALGDAWFAHMPNGRFRAADAYRQAQRLAPNDPAPPYQYAQVGLWLGGDDGEMMAKDGLERTLALDPFYGEAWDQWLTLFRSGGSRRQMAERLAPRRSDPAIRSRLALLAIEDERYPEADALLDSALATDSTNTAWLALRAQSAFEAGDTATGWAFYSSALAHADQDSTDALWHQVVGIASPGEVREWDAGVPPLQRQGWLESFWARRNPNLFAGTNLRVAEHFARLRYARKQFPLLHPLVSYHRNQIARAMNLEPSEGEREYYVRCEMYEMLQPPHLHPIPKEMIDSCGVDQECLARAAGVPMPGVSRASDRARVVMDPWALVTTAEWGSKSPNAPVFRDMRFLGLNLDLRSMDSVAARIGYNLAMGLDDRGVMYLRFGEPDRRYMGGKNPADPRCSVMDVERWNYARYGEVRFARPSAFSKGLRNVPDMVFRAMNERQFTAVRTGITRDASSEPAPLDFGVWTAQFADPADPAATDLVVVSTRGEIAAALQSDTARGDVWREPRGAVAVETAPGSYVLVAQVRDSGLIGRQELGIAIRSFSRTPAMSELLLAPAWEQHDVSRPQMVAHVQRTLSFASGSTIRSYAEVYGLRSESGTVRYHVEYLLLKTDSPERDIRRDEWPQATALEFQRLRPAAANGVEIETLDLVPAQVPAGKYLLRVRVQDLVTGADAGRATISFTVR